MKDLHYGFTAGNYANAYTSDDLSTATNREIVQRVAAGEPTPTEVWWAAYVIGFWSTYELSEIADPDYREEYAHAIAAHGPAMREAGIAID